MESNLSQRVTPSALRYAIVGIGGFATTHHESIRTLEKRGLAQLIATCDPRLDQLGGECHRLHFKERNVGVYKTFEALLAASVGRVDVLVIATPIPLHAAMHKKAVELGIPVYLEKPPTLDPQQLEAMIACDAKAVVETMVGFNFISQRERIGLKQRLVDGEFGRLQQVRVNGKRARSIGYFKRNDWAGKLLSRNDKLLLDSCFGNAAAHYVHSALHWAGASGCYQWADIAQVRAELFRAHAICGADTFFAEATTTDGVLIRIGMTHACQGQDVMEETVLTEHARITISPHSCYEIAWHDGRVERIREAVEDFDALITETHLAHQRFLRKESYRPLTRLADCRSFVQFNALCYVASGRITTFDPDRIAQVAVDGDTQLEVQGLCEAIDAFTQYGQWPAPLPFFNTAFPEPQAMGVDAVQHLYSVVKKMNSEYAAP